MNIEDNYYVCYYKYCEHKKIFAFDSKEIHQSHNQYVSQSMKSFSDLVENTTSLQLKQLMKLSTIQVLNEEICSQIKQIQIQIIQVLERLTTKIVSNNHQLQHQENILQQFLQSAQSIRNLQFNENDVIFIQNYLDGLIAPKFDTFELKRNEVLDHNMKIMEQIKKYQQNFCQQISVIESTSTIKTLDYEMSQQLEIQIQSVVEILDLNPYGIEEIIMNVRSNDFKSGYLQILNNDYIKQYEVKGIFYEPRYLKQVNVDSIVLFDLNNKMVKLLQKRQGTSICLSGSRSLMQWHPCTEISYLKDLSKVISINYQKQNRVFFINYMNEGGYQFSKRIDLKSGSIEILNNYVVKLRSFHPERLYEIQVDFTGTISFQINNNYQPLAFKLHQESILEFHFVDNDYLLTYDAKGMVKIWDTDILYKNAMEKSQETISCLSKIAINDKPILFNNMENLYVILGQKKYFYIIGFQEEQLKLVGKLLLTYQEINHLYLRDKNNKFEIICQLFNSQIIKVWSVDK